MIDSVMRFLDYFSGGAWPFLVGGMTCQVNSGNERDLYLLISGKTVECWITT